MKKIYSVVLASLAALMLLTGCQGTKAVVETDLTTFNVNKLEYNTSYGDGLQASAGNKLLVVLMTAAEAFDESKYKSYFQPEDGEAEGVKLHADGQAYECMAVGVKGKENDTDVQYVLVFDVPESVQKAKLITLEIPNRGEVAIKGKIAE